MSDQSVSETLLGNGLRLVTIPVAGRLSTALAIVFPAGARHEQDEEIGAGHLLEHLAFKGTEKHPTSTELNRAAEYLGTELDGTSTTEYVEFSTAVRAESAMPAAELLTELVATPLLEDAELDAERVVILQEIADSNDSPGSRADDLLHSALFAGHRLAKDVAGDSVDVQRITHDRLLAFRDRQWSPAAGLAVVAGNLDHLDPRHLQVVLEDIPKLPSPPPPAPLPPFVPRVEIEERDSEVVHLRLAYAVPGVDFKIRRHRAAAEVLSQLVGGPMGSRLFDELREQQALCYWVDGHIWGYDCATFLSISCSVSPANLGRAYEQIQAIVADLHTQGPTDEEAHRFSAYSTGAAALDFESVSQRLDHAVELIMEYDDHDVDATDHMRDIASINRSELTEVAASVNLQPCIGAVGSATEASFS